MSRSEVSRPSPPPAGPLQQFFGRNLRTVDADSPLDREISKPFWLGIAVIGLVVGGFGGWSATAELAGAVIAVGQVSPESSKQTVQHLEGGIIQAILAKDGDEVTVGRPLLVLESVQHQADLSAARSQLYALAAEEIRLLAERRGEAKLVFDDPVLRDRHNPEVERAIEVETNRFNARRNADVVHVGVLVQRIAQSNQQIEGYKRQIEGIVIQQGLLREETNTVSDLVDRGLEHKPRLLALQRQLAGNDGQIGGLDANIASVKENIQGLELQIADLKAKRIETLEDRLADVQTKRKVTEETIKKSLDLVSRTVVRAPVSGTVFNSHYKTVGGVIPPGNPILDIIPAHEELIVEAHVSDKDIDEVHTGQQARIIFTSFPQRHMQRINGELTFVAADSVVDDQTKKNYYLAKVKIDLKQLHEVAPNVQLEAGMPAEVFIATANRTAIDYLTYPLRVAMQRVMREN